MTDTENVFDGFALLGDDEEFDVDKIFGSGSDEPAPPPPAPTLAEEVKPQFDPEQVQTETAESQPEPEQTLPAKTQEVPAEEKQPLELFSAFTSAESDPIPEAAPVKSIAPRPQTQLSLFDKPPVFQYGGAREQITDPDMTFESLRIQKADDFPELEDASAVTWQVRYLIQSGSRSPAIMERWINKIATLEQKKQHYEEILRRELDGLDDDFETLRLLSQELSVRANGLRFRKAA